MTGAADGSIIATIITVHIAKRLEPVGHAPRAHVGHAHGDVHLCLIGHGIHAGGVAHQIEPGERRENDEPECRR